MRLSPPFVIRISCDGKPDRYLKNMGEILTFKSMKEGFVGVDVFRHVFEDGEYPAVVPLSVVPVEQR